MVWMCTFETNCVDTDPATSETGRSGSTRSWSGTFVPRWRLHNNLHMIPSFDGLVLVHGTFGYWVTLNPGLGGVSGSIQLSTATHEQVQSNRTCNISHCLCSAFSRDPYYTFYLLFTVALFVQCGGRKKSPRAFSQYCHSFRSLVIVEHSYCACLYLYQSEIVFSLYLFGLYSYLGGSTTPAVHG